jgi:hypothetical protein
VLVLNYSWLIPVEKLYERVKVMLAILFLPGIIKNSLTNLLNEHIKKLDEVIVFCK